MNSRKSVRYGFLLLTVTACLSCACLNRGSAGADGDPEPESWPPARRWPEAIIENLTEIELSADQPAFRRPETLVLAIDRPAGVVKAEYSGLRVQGQTNFDCEIQPPATLVFPAATWGEIVRVIREHPLWYIAQQGRGGEYSTFVITLVWAEGEGTASHSVRISDIDAPGALEDFNRVLTKVSLLILKRDFHEYAWARFD